VDETTFVFLVGVAVDLAGAVVVGVVVVAAVGVGVVPAI
jgi:hypothetical protein